MIRHGITTTSKEQLHKFRMAHTLDHLETGASVKKVPYSLGFRDPSAFSHAFQRWTGQSTREYRRDDKMPMPRNPQSMSHPNCFKRIMLL